MFLYTLLVVLEYKIIHKRDLEAIILTHKLLGILKMYVTKIERIILNFCTIIRHIKYK